MTVVAKTTRVQYTGTGLVSTYAYGWKILDEADLVVVKTVSGVDTALTLTTDYTVTGVGNSAGGNVVLTSSLAPGALLTIYMEMDIAQPDDYTNQKAAYLETIEGSLDRLALISQQLAEGLGRCLQNTVVAGAALTFADIQAEATAADAARGAAVVAQGLAEDAQGLAEDAADLAQGWAEGTTPGGPGTKSAKEWAEEAEEAAANVSARKYAGTASAGQTVITPGFTWNDAAGNIVVFVDGLKQATNAYTLTSPTITLSEALAGGETIEVYSIDFTAAPGAPLYPDDIGVTVQGYDPHTMKSDVSAVRTKAHPSTLSSITTNSWTPDLTTAESFDWTPTGSATLNAPTISGAGTWAIRYNYSSGPTLPKSTYDGSAWAKTGDILLLIGFASGDYELVWLNKA